MKILILGSVALPVPPPMQGGTERIAHWQALGLAKRGHEVTLIAAHGSVPDPSYTLVEIGGGDTVTGSAKATPGDASEVTEGSRKLRKEAVYLSDVSQYILEHGKEYDVILNNMRAGESLFVPVAQSVGVPFVSVMHLPMFEELAGLFRRHITPVITISNAQRVGYGGLKYVGTAYNTTDFSQLEFRAEAGEYLLMMGSIAPHKNQKAGIDVAKKLGKKLIIAGKIGNQQYYDAEIRPHIDGTTIELRGEMGLEERKNVLSHAEALLFPIIWPEPFGLVMIEAMASGTPVVAYANGAVPEVVRDGVTGFIVDEKDRDARIHSPWKVDGTGVAGLVSAVQRIAGIDRATCRKHVEDNFSMNVMMDSLEDALGASVSV